MFGLISCSSNSHGPIETTDAETEEICRLGENLALIKTPVSFSMVGEDRFVISDRNGVYLYGTDGNQISRIGRTGRAKSEYNMPPIARCFGDSVYIWCPMSLKFVTWSLDGQPGAEYRYPSAVSDFTPTDDELFIYTAGRRFDNVIDVYDKNTQAVKKTLLKSTSEHQFLIAFITSYPMLIEGDNFYFMPKDRLSVMDYEISADELKEKCSFLSDTFVVDDGLYYDLMVEDRTTARAELRENSQTLFLSPSRKGFYVLTKEGTGKLEGEKNDFSDTAISLYDTGKRNVHIASYSYDSIGTLELFGHWEDNVYFIRHDVKDGNDIYTLNRLVIQ